LYSSDGKAVQELLKLATLLYQSSKTTTKKLTETESDHVPPPIKVGDVKMTRQLASEITQSGAKLYDLLENEVNERLERSRALRFLDSAATTAEGSKEQLLVERKIREIIENTKQSVEDMRCVPSFLACSCLFFVLFSFRVFFSLPHSHFVEKKVRNLKQIREILNQKLIKNKKNWKEQKSV
jgi:hypothetical protein